ncbi:MAG: GNAT family N-acetyltransferase [Salinivirgaceae bacterium]|jgi:GNAT superfamily N-acetyltransferase|nr:GNAT family N-acetyltransferase [Salinivirgaceae bacterium]
MREFHNHQGQKFKFRRLAEYDSEALGDYFENLSDETKQKFGPHALTKSYATFLCHRSLENAMRFVLEDEKSLIQGYFIVDFNLIDHEAERYASNGIELKMGKDVFFAPSLADNLQNSGLGSQVTNRIIEILKEDHISTVVLLGGTRENNQLALKFYENMGFKKVGGYQTDVWNFDMQLKL